jgi:hypothetical protein
MKKILLGAALLGFSTMAMAEAPGGPNCGWGNMVFKGQSGPIPHFGALTTNGTSGNATFGMTSGSNGCSTDGKITYGGKAMITLNGVLDEFVADAARGQGEALTAVAVSMDIKPEDRAAFAAMVHSRFDAIVPDANVTASEVYQNLVKVMKADARLAGYAS